jgi:hypothetical protein
MSQWKQWFRGFLSNWLDVLAMSLSKLDDGTRKQFEATLSTFSSPEIEGFGEAWSKLENPESVKEQVEKVLSSIDDPSQAQKDSLKEWMSILMSTIEEQDENTRAQLLGVCGEACAGHATDSFKKLWESSGNLKEFLENMNTQMCEGDNVYRYVDENTIEIAYPRCLCPIVGFGLVENPTLCNCSSSWLKTNFEATFGKSAEVQRIDTVLNGHSSCSFKVTMT